LAVLNHHDGGEKNDLEFSLCLCSVRPFPNPILEGDDTMDGLVSDENRNGRPSKRHVMPGVPQDKMR